MKEDERFFYLSLSNTVGGAILNERKLQQGKAFRCGEVGHMTIVPDGKLCYCGKKVVWMHIVRQKYYQVKRMENWNNFLKN